MIPVTKSFFPPIQDYQDQVQRIWDNQWLTNNGVLLQELQEKLIAHLKVKHIIPMTNGTLPLHIALKALAKGGEVITTPFSYVATTASIVWEQCTPVFVDIHPEYLTIDETKIEEAITNETTAILATHVYGNPCNVDVIESIAKKHDLKVIYDAAHCFGVRYKGQSIFNYGDVSTCSFHATKLFHTGEGGAAFVNNEKMKHELFFRHNFGHNGPIAYHGLGTNAKMSELQAAMGLSVLQHMAEIIKSRKTIVDFYNANLDFDKLQKLKIRPKTKWNYSYYPIVFPTEKDLLITLDRLNANDIFPRRYFYPSLETLPYVNSNHCHVADDLACRIVCLPLYYDLKIDELKLITDIVAECLNKKNKF